MTYDQQTALVRTLKGAAGSILWILLLSGRTLTAVQLQEATGYSDKPVSAALARLLAPHVGFSVVVLLALALYGVAAAAFRH